MQAVNTEVGASYLASTQINANSNGWALTQVGDSALEWLSGRLKGTRYNKHMPIDSMELPQSKQLQTHVQIAAALLFLNAI